MEAGNYQHLATAMNCNLFPAPTAELLVGSVDYTVWDRIVFSAASTAEGRNLGQQFAVEDFVALVETFHRVVGLHHLEIVDLLARTGCSMGFEKPDRKDPK